MSSDLQALLAAIVTDPADDVARLVYADCLEEHGNAARAAFIRLQIEAERHHPDSNARAALEEQARVLFQQHWREWWGEVCAAVGLELVDSRRYHISESTTVGFVQPEVTPEEREDVGRSEITFRRGFPEVVTASRLMGDFATMSSNLARWPTVSPLAEMTVVGWLDSLSGAWPEGTHLSGVRNLTFDNYDPGALRAALRSPHLTRLESLKLTGSGYGRGWTNPDDLAAIVASPHAPRLTRLDIPVQSLPAAEIIASAETLTRLESLSVDTGYYGSSALLTALANGSRLANIRRLSVRCGGQHGGMGDIGAVTHQPTWARLRYLDLELAMRSGPLTALLSPDILPELEECRLRGLHFDSETAHQLVRSPLLKRLRHFALTGGQYRNGRVFLPLVDAVDPARIETFAIGIPYFPERAANALRAKFGDRVRFLLT